MIWTFWAGTRPHQIQPRNTSRFIAKSVKSTKAHCCCSWTLQQRSSNSFPSNSTNLSSILLVGRRRCSLFHSLILSRLRKLNASESTMLLVTPQLKLATQQETHLSLNTLWLRMSQSRCSIQESNSFSNTCRMCKPENSSQITRSCARLSRSVIVCRSFKIHCSRKSFIHSRTTLVSSCISAH